MSVSVFALLAVFVVSLFAGLPTAAAGTSSNSNGYSSTQLHTIMTSMSNIEDSVDQNFANATATATATFLTYSSVYNLKFNSVFETFSFNHALVVTLQSVNVVYSFAYPNGTRANLVLTESPSMASVSSSQVQPGVSMGGGTTQESSNWAGYALMGAAPGSASYPNLWVADGTWTVPAVTEASNLQCDLTYCAVAPWVGVTDELGGSPDHNIVQAGTTSQIYCTSSCTAGSSGGSSYYSWYEFSVSSTSSSVKCATISSGDTVDAAAYSGAYNGGTSTTWYVNVIDTNTASGCGSNGNPYSQSYTSFSPNPAYGNWIVERPLIFASPNYLAHLPSFSSVTFTSDYICYEPTGTNCSLPFPGIYTPYSKTPTGWYYPFVMCNGGTCPPGTGTNDITSGAISSSSSFTATYQSSVGT